MATSQNGWGADDVPLENREIAGVRMEPGVRAGDVATVLYYLAQRFHDSVEPLRSGECWGYAKRNIRGSSTAVSNHASGTAVDFNAPEHWLGERNTYSTRQVAQIHAIINDELEGVVRWGGDYSGRKDEMHFEIVEDAGRVAALAAALRGEKPVVPDVPPFPLGNGYFGPGGVTEGPGLGMFQARLAERGWRIGADGLYGPETARVTKAFQHEKNLVADGLIGPRTWAAAWTERIT